MQRIGLLGGMSYESSALYYTLINELVNERLGGYHSARCVLASVDFAEIERMQADGDWDTAAELLAAEARGLRAAGADFVVLCTNTMHKVADRIEQAAGIPLLHLGDVTATAVREAGLDTVGLLGTRFTMEQSFYTERIASHGLTVLTPTPDEQQLVHEVIYSELVHGRIREESRQRYREVIDALVARGAAGVVLGCTEIELLIGPEHSPVPVFATTRLHAEAAVRRSLDS